MRSRRMTTSAGNGLLMLSTSPACGCSSGSTAASPSESAKWPKPGTCCRRSAPTLHTVADNDLVSRRDFTGYNFRQRTIGDPENDTPDFRFFLAVQNKDKARLLRFPLRRHYFDLIRRIPLLSGRELRRRSLCCFICI